jgi:hypothetical protein
MPLLSARFIALPAAALAVIVALSQAHSQAGTRSAEITPTVQRVTNCALPTNSVAATACAVATADGATVMR